MALVLLGWLRAASKPHVLCARRRSFRAEVGQVFLRLGQIVAGLVVVLRLDFNRDVILLVGGEILAVVVVLTHAIQAHRRLMQTL